MNIRIPTMLGIALILSACGGSNPFMTSTDPVTDTGTVTEPTIPEAVRGDVDTIVYDATAQTLTVSGVTLDNTDISATYTRTTALDVTDANGNVVYQGYLTQSDPLDRPAIAYAREAGNTSAVRGITAVTGGQFNRYFGGVHFERDGVYTPPAVTDQNQGLVSYAGRYVGLTNIQTENVLLLAPDAGTPDVLTPGAPAIIEGNIFLNVDFADNSVNGAIYDRDFRDAPGIVALPNVILVSTDIDDTGRFSSDRVEYQGNLTLDIGDYAGIFGGPNAEGVAGGVRLTEFDGPSDPNEIEDEEEYGVFVLDQCGTPDADAAICTQVRP